MDDDQIEGIIIATPAALHFKWQKEASNHGKDVFVEKPLSLHIEEEKLVKNRQRKPEDIDGGHILHYHPAIIKTEEMISQGELGKIQYIYSNRLNLGKFRTEENILWSFAPHDISVILMLLGKCH